MPDSNSGIDPSEVSGCVSGQDMVGSQKKVAENMRSTNVSRNLAMRQICAKTTPNLYRFSKRITSILGGKSMISNVKVKHEPQQFLRSKWRYDGRFSRGIRFTPVAGLIFKTKNRAIFLERFFGREITAREQLSRAVILARF